MPTVNIGDRQRGRLQSESVINCATDKSSIMVAIQEALSAEHRRICCGVVSPYGDGTAAEKIAHETVEVVISGTDDLKKKFFDI